MVPVDVHMCLIYIIRAKREGGRWHEFASRDGLVHSVHTEVACSIPF